MTPPTLTTRTDPTNITINHPPTTPPCGLNTPRPGRAKSETPHIGRIVVEHTRVESFAGQLQDDHRLASLFPGYRLSAVIPAGLRLDLAVRAGACDGIAKKRLGRVALEIRAWIESNYHQLEPVPRGSGRLTTIAAEPPETPIALTISRVSDDHPGEDGVVQVARFAPHDLELERARRVRTALERKLPKLLESTEADDCSVLVLEMSDLALGNVGMIAAAAKATSVDLELPDVIVIVDTCDEWLGCIVFSNGVWIDRHGCERLHPHRKRTCQIAVLAKDVDQAAESGVF